MGHAILIRHCFLAVAMASCIAPSITAQEKEGSKNKSQEGQGLRDWVVHKKIGFEISPENISEQPFVQTMVREASVGTVTAYWMLPGASAAYAIVDEQGNYRWARPDSVVEFCAQHGIPVHGHTLVWAKQEYSPTWLQKQSPDQVRSALRNHIRTVVDRYRGRVEAWHVINEAIDYRGKMNESIWSRSLGSQLFEEAFQTAAAADPKAILIYNDYDMELKDDRKFKAVVAMVKQLQKKEIPIHGIGWQLHVNVSQILEKDFPLEARMNTIADLGIDNYVTELDMAIGKPGTTAIPAKSRETLEQQRLAYKKLFDILLRVRRLPSIQFWGVSDKQSWLGVKQFPLLFDENFQAKPAYLGVRQALMEHRSDQP